MVAIEADSRKRLLPQQKHDLEGSCGSGFGSGSTRLGREEDDDDKEIGGRDDCPMKGREERTIFVSDPEIYYML